LSGSINITVITYITSVSYSITDIIDVATRISVEHSTSQIWTL